MGGMGVVFAAYDPDLRRRVALKLLRPGLESSSGQQRLLREAQSMARLQHPNVIAVHDVGTSGDNVFLAMELVAGVNLRRWINQQRRRLSEVIAVFLQAGRGLAAAHAAGLIHRDFKPDNVLVGDDGRVRVTDFGLAKQARQDGGPDERTDPGALRLVGTPAYIAPEIVAGHSADVRSDQFSFCVALHEALRGRRPASVDAGSPIEPIIDENQLRSTPLPRSLERVLRRGLDPRPAQRYPSMDALLADLARRPGRSWQLSALAVTLLLATLAASLAYVGVIRRRDLLCKGAEQRLTGVWDPERVRSVRSAFAATRLPYAEAAFAAVSRTLDRYTRSWVSMHTEACEATRLRGAQTEEVLSLRMVCLEGRRRELAVFVDLLADANSEVVENAPLAAERLSDIDGCADLQTLFARRLRGGSSAAHRRAQIEAVLAEVRADAATGRYAQAVAGAQVALEGARALADHATLADALFLVGRSQYQLGQMAIAERSLSEAVLEAEAAGLDDTKVRALTIMVAIAGVNRFTDAHQYVARAAAAIERLGGDLRLKVLLFTQEAELLRNEGRFADARARIEQAVAIYALLPNTDPLHQAQLINELSLALEAVGHREQALAQARRALELRETTLGKSHPLVAHELITVAASLLDADRSAEALPLLQRAVAIWETTTVNNLQLADALDNLGTALGPLGRYTEAAAAHQRAIALYDKLLGPENAQSAIALQNLANLYSIQHRPREAERLLSQSIAITEGAQGHDHPDLVYSLGSLSDVELTLGRPAEALRLAERAFAIQERTLGTDNPETARTLLLIARAQLAQHYATAAQSFDRALRLLAQHSDAPKLLAQAQFGMARTLRNDHDRALRLARTALATYERLGDRDEAEPIKRWLSRDR
jgi:tetratricopeptide (TPR) repeat protein